MITAPICEFVRRYRYSGALRMHMPGHKGTALLGPEPLDLTGAWTTRTEDADSWQELVIEGDSMRVEWVYDDGETRSLYWAGTYDAPDEATEEWAWTSENDHSATDVALLASTSDEKEFSYADGAISYEVSAMGTTTTLHATRQEAEE